MVNEMRISSIHVGHSQHVNVGADLDRVRGNLAPAEPHCSIRGCSTSGRLRRKQPCAEDPEEEFSWFREKRVVVEQQLLVLHAISVVGTYLGIADDRRKAG